MDADLKAKWCAALRSGEYRQAKHCLVDNAGALCCLGVLHLVITGSAPTGSWGDDNPQPEQIAVMVHDQAYAPLIRMNDFNGNTFPEIADWIEANL